LTTDLYRKYLAVVMDKLDATPLPRDILQVSSETICELLDQYSGSRLPEWCRLVSWGEYADSRYERPTRRLDALLAPENYRKSIGEGEHGWSIQADSVKVSGEKLTCSDEHRSKARYLIFCTTTPRALATRSSSIASRLKIFSTEK